MMRLIVIVANWSKSCQKVEELSPVKKSQRPEKSKKAISLEESSFLTFNTRLAFTKMGSRDTKLTIENYRSLLESLKIGSLTNSKYEVLIFIQASIFASIPARFVGLENSLDTVFTLITSKVKLVELLMLCCLFSQRSQEDLWAEHLNSFLLAIFASQYL